MPENREVIELWNYCATQWRVSMAGRIGLDYNVVFKMAKILGIEVIPGLIKKMQILEQMTLENDLKGANNK